MAGLGMDDSTLIGAASAFDVTANAKVEINRMCGEYVRDIKRISLVINAPQIEACISDAEIDQEELKKCFKKIFPMEDM